MTQPLLHACTIVARNYLPYARALTDSFCTQHPGSRFTTLILDGHEGLHEPFGLIGPYDIGIERSELHRMAMIYDVKEFATAVKPWLLRRLLDEGGETAVYFDPDIVVYAPLDDIGTHASEHGIVLTPHSVAPLPNDGRLPDYKMIMQAGVYNLGFIAVSRQADGFLDWWSQRLARDCLNSVEEGLFVDQRWIDFVPALFDHYVLRDATCNVAYWNLHARELTWTGDRYEVDGRALRFFHFSGFKPDTPNILSHHMGTRPRIALRDHPDLARICREYSAQLFDRGYGSVGAARYAFDWLAKGIQIDQPMRRLFRQALLEAERDGGTLPTPFDSSSSSEFLQWLREPVRGRRAEIPRYAYALYLSRPDLQTAFPDVLGSDAPRYLEWVQDYGQANGLPSELLAQPLRRRSLALRRRAMIVHSASALEKRLRLLAHRHPHLTHSRLAWRAFDRVRQASRGAGLESLQAGGVSEPRSLFEVDIAEAPTAGVNVVGYLSAELGVGEVARKIISGLERAGIDFSTIAYDRTHSRQQHLFTARRPQQAPFDTNIICVNADQLPFFREEVGEAFFTGRHSIGVWFWEIAHFPKRFHDSFRFVDEVWVATSFVRDALSRATDKPITIVPLPLEAPSPPRLSRGELGLPEGFVFLFSFDALSVLERKNPVGLVDAFTRAFADGEGPTLVLKSINSGFDPAGMKRLRAVIAARNDIQLFDGYVSPDEKNALMASCDCYVSLHRSEGFGLTMAEAMAYGKPVIATGYSGNLEFMNEGNSHLIPYTLEPIPSGCEPYPGGEEWADPDLDVASEAMRRVFEDPDSARALGARAREEIMARFSVDRTADFLLDRLSAAKTIATSLANGTENASSADAPLRVATTELARGPGGDFVCAKRGRPGVRGGRAAVRKVLWPYFLDRHRLDVAVVEAAAGLARDLAGVQRTLNQLGRELRGVQQVASRLEQGLSGHQRAERHLDALQQSVRQLGEELTAVPYVSDPALVWTTDSHANCLIGYEGAEEVDDVAHRFQDVFRGPEHMISERQRGYLEAVGGRAPVLDVGCGRGEFLQLLRDAGIEAWGIDVNAHMVDYCRDKGLSVERADAISYLEAQEDQSLGVVFSAQVIEHLAYEDLMRFIELAREKLRVGGLLIVETVNPHSIQAFKTFWTDLTHRAPIFPEVALTLARLHGFGSARIEFPLGVGDLERDRRTCGEYALVATVGSRLQSQRCGQKSSGASETPS